MSEEEAIERLKERVKLDRKIRNNKIESDYEQFCENECQAIEAILNLADKRQKEIEEKNVAINKMSKDISRQLEEIDEKSTIIMAGAEKVKQLEKEIEELKSIASEFTNRNIEQFSIGEFNFKVKHFKDNYIHKDKIRELKEKVEKEMISNPYDFSYMINEILEEN